jgi:hypothetical protein
MKSGSEKTIKPVPHVSKASDQFSLTCASVNAEAARKKANACQFR